MLTYVNNFKEKKDIDIKVTVWEIIIRILIIIIHTENFMRNDDSKLILMYWLKFEILL